MYVQVTLKCRASASYCLFKDEEEQRGRNNPFNIYEDFPLRFLIISLLTSNHGKEENQKFRIRINKILTLDPHLWPINITTSYLSLPVLKMKIIINILKYKVFNRFLRNGITIVINCKPDRLYLVHTLILPLKAISSFQKVIIIQQLGNEMSSEKYRRSTQFQDLSPLQAVPRQTVHPKLRLSVSSQSKWCYCHHSTQLGHYESIALPVGYYTV